MKQKLLTTAGALALLAVLGKYYAQPVFAQVRAALVSDVDNPARGFIQFSRSVGPPQGTTTREWRQDLQYMVPPGKRLVIDNLSALSFELSTNTMTTPFLLVIGNNAGECNGDRFNAPFPNAFESALVGTRASVSLPLVFNGLENTNPPHNSYGNSMHVQAYADAGQCLGGRFTTSSPMTFATTLAVTVSGHLVTP